MRVLKITTLFRLKVIKYDDINELNRKTLSSTFKGAVFNYLTQVLYLNKLNHKSFTYVICREHFLLNPITVYFRKSFYLTDDVNELISMLHANGLIDHWISDYADSKYLMFSQHSSKQEPERLSINHLKGIFIVWLVGISIASFTFLIEILSSKLSIRFRN